MAKPEPELKELRVAPGRSLPELADVWWRRPMDEAELTRRGRISTAYTAVYVTPFIVIGVALLLIEPLLFPVAMWSFAHAWVIPELFAHRGARVAFPLDREGGVQPERTALGLLGDLWTTSRGADVGERAGADHGRMGAWLVGEAGALLVRPNGWRVHCFCVRRPTRTSRAVTGSPTCCSRCARTRSASRPSRTTPSPARPGGSAGV